MDLGMKMNMKHLTNPYSMTNQEPIYILVFNKVKKMISIIFKLFLVIRIKEMFQFNLKKLIISLVWIHSLQILLLKKLSLIDQSNIYIFIYIIFYSLIYLLNIICFNIHK